MKKFFLSLCLIFGIVSVGFAQEVTPLQQSFVMSVVAAPPAVVSGQSYSTSATTGVSAASTGGAVAAGSWRVCVTYFSSTNTETPCSVDTAATSIITTTGTTSVVTIYPPVPTSGAGNVVGWRMYVGASGGAAGQENLQTITSSICTLSTSGTASCALTSPAVFTASTNFTAPGTSPPATPGTLITPPLAQQASIALFENSLYTYHTLNWVVSGTAPSACTVRLYNGTAPGSLSAAGTIQTCTATGSYNLPGSTTAAYWGVDVISMTPGDTTTVVQFTYDSYLFPPSGTMPDGVWNVPLGACGLTLTTGALGSSTTGANPGINFAATGNAVLQVLTTSAASVTKLDCDVTPPTRSSSGKGVTVTGLQLFYGAQTTAFNAITAPTVQTVTYAATGGSSQGTVATAGGSLSVTPATLQLATTTTGQCYSENISFATPVSLNTALQRLTLEQIFNQNTAAVQTVQICGVQVFYNNNPL